MRFLFYCTALVYLLSPTLLRAQNSNLASEQEIRQFCEYLSLIEHAKSDTEDIKEYLESLVGPKDSAIWKDFEKEIHHDTIINILIKKLQQDFTQEEIRAYNHFFQSPLGQKLEAYQWPLVDFILTSNEQWKRRLEKDLLSRIEQSDYSNQAKESE